MGHPVAGNGSGNGETENSFFRGLLSDRSYRFELGLRTSLSSWFNLPPEDPTGVLQERRDGLRKWESQSFVWSQEAEPLFLELATQFDPPLNRTNDASATRETAFHLAGHWSPDFLLLSRSEGDRFRFVGGAVCFPSGWAPEEKLGLSVDAIHVPVPGLNDQLGSRMDAFLAKLNPGQSFDRFNWGISASPDRNHHPHRKLPGLDSGFPFSAAWLRLEHQRFFGLPQTGGIVFLIELTVHPLGELVSDSVVAEGLAHQLATMPEAVGRYKGLDAVRERWVVELKNHR